MIYEPVSPQQQMGSVWSCGGWWCDHRNVAGLKDTESVCCPLFFISFAAQPAEPFLGAPCSFLLFLFLKPIESGYERVPWKFVPFVLTYSYLLYFDQNSLRETQLY